MDADTKSQEEMTMVLPNKYVKQLFEVLLTSDMMTGFVKEYEKNSPNWLDQLREISCTFGNATRDTRFSELEALGNLRELTNPTEAIGKKIVAHDHGAAAADMENVSPEADRVDEKMPVTQKTKKLQAESAGDSDDQQQEGKSEEFRALQTDERAKKEVAATDPEKLFRCPCCGKMYESEAECMYHMDPTK